MFIFLAELKTKAGKRDELISAILDAEIVERFKEQAGNEFYSLSCSISDPDVIVVNDGWADKAAFDAHAESEDCAELGKLFDTYIEGPLREGGYEV